MKVLKFGGTSVGSPENIKKVKKIVNKNSSRIFIVVSAFSGTTDLLYQSGKKAKLKDTSYLDLLKKIEKKHLDCIKNLFIIQEQSKIISEIKFQINQLENLLEGIFLVEQVSNEILNRLLSFGEIFSSYIISEYFKSQNLNCIYKDSRELIKTHNTYSLVKVDFKKTNQNILLFWESTNYQITILPGFIASDYKNNKTTTLGRGGSDYSASIYAAALPCKALEIWTDVSGMFTTNPKLANNAKVITEISYEEALELSYFGAKVLYPLTILPVFEKEIPIYIKNTFSPKDQGTLIVKNPKLNTNIVTGITNIDDISLLSLKSDRNIEIFEIINRIFYSLSKHTINVILTTQASSEYTICIAIKSKQSKLAKLVIDKNFQYEIHQKKINPVKIESGFSIIAIVKENINNAKRLISKTFNILENNNINIRAISQGSSTRNISIIIETRNVKKAINCLHEYFFENAYQKLNIFVAGIGNVGSKFLEQILKQKSYLNNQLKININVIGIANSKNMIFNEYGIDLNSYKEILSKGETSDFNKFFDQIKSLNLINSIFIDNTSSYKIPLIYDKYLLNNIAIVTCNKIACSSNFENYFKLKNISQNYSVPFLFETNVGAALPIIYTLQNLIRSGDKILKIEAVLSGSLNFILNNFNESVDFYQIVNEAKEKGYTESDPRIDLSGIDVMRKILILARESGYKININDIKNNSFLPRECLETTSLEMFMNYLKKYNNHFLSLYKKAKSKNNKLRYVASFQEGKAEVGIQEISIKHPFYHLEEQDNIILFYSKRYCNQPIIIKGAGAGAEVTASGIFANVIRIAKI